ncbi:MAG TPA: DUF1206 domain-containing protein [Nocardioides sp.]|uniref:DUF1206 domain-containing protein n=1 Tax=Nocardioides sp. TaxID=35761 RepID=UPI002D80AD86|nr:DUF1206 domain-containing protein [Nocardioides sp.]HET6652932.1 DUF1206 domain-containing protein [Nocardioides sp.]
MDHDDALDVGVRVGLVSYGIVHLLMAWLALQLVFGDREGNVSGSGALRQLAGTELGRISLYVVGAGFVALVVWQLFEAAAGHRDEEGAKRAGKRVVSLSRAVIYGALGWGALRIAVGGQSGGGKSTDSLTARLMSLPFGVILVALVGAVIVGIAIGLAWNGWREKFLDMLDSSGHTGKDGQTYRWFGKAGYISKGVAFAVVGGLFLYAAWTHDPDKSGGLDQALLQLLEQPFGPALLALVAAGIACFGLFCFAWARHLDR